MTGVILCFNVTETAAVGLPSSPPAVTALGARRGFAWRPSGQLRPLADPGPGTGAETPLCPRECWPGDRTPCLCPRRAPRGLTCFPGAEPGGPGPARCPPRLQPSQNSALRRALFQSPGGVTGTWAPVRPGDNSCFLKRSLRSLRKFQAHVLKSRPCALLSDKRVF